MRDRPGLIWFASMNDPEKDTIRRVKIKTKKNNRNGMPIVLVSLVFCWLAFYFGKLHYENYVEMNANLAKVTREHTEKLKKIERLEAEKARLNDPEYLKQIAREQQFYMKPNEVLIKLNPDPSKQAAPADKDGAPAPKK